MKHVSLNFASNFKIKEQVSKVLASGSRKGDLSSLDLPHPSHCPICNFLKKCYGKDMACSLRAHPQSKTHFLHNNCLLDANPWLKKPSVYFRCQRGKSYKTLQLISSCAKFTITNYPLLLVGSLPCDLCTKM